MKVRPYGLALLIVLCVQWLAPETRLFGQAPQDPQGFQSDYTAGPSWFPSFYRPYQQQRIGPMILENSRRLADLIRDGNLELSLADALALALENNLDIAVARYIAPMAQADILRARSGQAARGAARDRFLALMAAGSPSGTKIAASGTAPETTP